MPFRSLSKRLQRLLFAVMILCASTVASRADEVTDWTRIGLQATHIATTSSLNASRSMAILAVSMFDAVNGIRDQYQFYFVRPAASRDASARAAAVQAAYASLAKLYPTQIGTLDTARTNSLNAILNEPVGWLNQQRHKQAVDDGIAWGQTVADAIWQLRGTDGFTPAPPPFLGGTAVGEWRPTPPAFAPGAGPQFAYMTPWVLRTPAQYRPGPPPLLTSARYTADFNEVKLMGSLNSTLRSADQTLAAQFWASTTPVYSWNSVALSLTAKTHHTLSQNARLFALLNTAIADATISLWEAKYHYVTWRPVTAIRLADTDNNPATAADPGWLPVIVTPAHPEYPSAHSGQSGAAVTVLAAFFGEHTPFTVDSDGLAGVVRTFNSFDDAMTEIAEARIYGGIHFRTSCYVARVEGDAVAHYVLRNAFQEFRRKIRDEEQERW